VECVGLVAEAFQQLQDKTLRNVPQKH
jgi:hypothetical protein